MSAAQFAFDWPITPSCRREDFIVTPANADAYHLVEAWPHWPLHALVLAGPAGAGKTHLASLWQDRSGAITLHDAGDLDQALALPGARFIVESGSSAFDHEQGLFHLLNNAMLGACELLVTVQDPARFDGVRLPDLLSRLRALPLAQLQTPDDMLLRTLLMKQCSDRQMTLDEASLTYILHHTERSAAAIRHLVDTLDKIALSEGHALSPFHVARYVRNITTHNIIRSEEQLLLDTRAQV